MWSRGHLVSPLIIRCSNYGDQMTIICSQIRFPPSSIYLPCFATDLVRPCTCPCDYEPHQYIGLFLWKSRDWSTFPSLNLSYTSVSSLHHGHGSNFFPVHIFWESMPWYLEIIGATRIATEQWLQLSTAEWRTWSCILRRTDSRSDPLRLHYSHHTPQEHNEEESEAGICVHLVIHQQLCWRPDGRWHHQPAQWCPPPS